MDRSGAFCLPVRGLLCRVLLISQADVRARSITYGRVDVLRCSQASGWQASAAGALHPWGWSHRPGGDLSSLLRPPPCGTLLASLPGTVVFEEAQSACCLCETKGQSVSIFAESREKDVETTQRSAQRMALRVCLLHEADALPCHHPGWPAALLTSAGARQPTSLGG